MRALPLLLVLAACQERDLPDRTHAVSAATDGLEHMGRKSEDCRCHIPEGTNYVVLACTDVEKDFNEEVLEWQDYFDLRMNMPPTRNRRTVRRVAWMAHLASFDGPTNVDRGWAKIEAGPNETDPRGGDLTDVWFPLHIENLQADSGGLCDSQECNPAFEGGRIEDGHYWCRDENVDPWDVNPNWRGTPVLRTLPNTEVLR